MGNSYTYAMPTPFSHLQIANRLLADSSLSEQARLLMVSERPAFLLGSVVADAKIPDAGRDATHFYHYTRPMPDNPWREMFRQHPNLQEADSPAHQAFLMAYVAHLASDEYWSRHMLYPYIANGDWGGDMSERFVGLHLMLVHMDERDVDLLPMDNTTLLRRSEPHDWLPFLPDTIIRDWRDYMVEQLEGESLTLEILAGRIRKDPVEFRSILDDSKTMHKRLWQNIEPPLLRHIEAEMYKFSREQMEIYLREINHAAGVESGEKLEKD